MLNSQARRFQGKNKDAPKEHIGVSLKQWYPQIIHFNRVFHYKPSILGENPLFLETPIWIFTYSISHMSYHFTRNIGTPTGWRTAMS